MPIIHRSIIDIKQDHNGVLYQVVRLIDHNNTQFFVEETVPTVVYDTPDHHAAIRDGAEFAVEDPMNIILAHKWRITTSLAIPTRCMSGCSVCEDADGGAKYYRVS